MPSRVFFDASTPAAMGRSGWLLVSVYTIGETIGPSDQVPD